LNEFVTAFERRVASFDRAAIVEAKRLIKRVGLLGMDDLRKTITALPGVVASAAPGRRRLYDRRGGGRPGEHLNRDGNATTFRVHGGGLIIGRIINEFGIARTVTGALKESLGSAQAS
jgi:hypothetical protein